MGDNTLIVKTWKEHQSEEKTNMLIRWFLWLVGIGILTLIVFSMGLFSFQTSLIIGIILFIILFFLFIFRRKVWKILKNQKNKGIKILILLFLIIIIVIGIFFYNFFNSKQNPLVNSPQTNTFVNNTKIPEIKNYTDIEIQQIYDCMICGMKEEEIFSKCGKPTLQENDYYYWVGNDLTIRRYSKTKWLYKDKFTESNILSKEECGF